MGRETPMYANILTVANSEKKIYKSGHNEYNDSKKKNYHLSPQSDNN
jgi:hypothetical protein